MKLLHNMILRWKQQGKTIVIAEHRLAYIWNLIDRVIFLESGKIAKDMQPAEFLKLSETELHSMGLRSNNEQKISKMHKANPKRYAYGTVVEGRLDKGRGPVA